MILSFIVYLFSALFLFALARNFVRRTEYVRIKKHENVSFFSPEIISSILYFALICGIRYNVGVDNLSYIRDYNTLLETGHWSTLKGDYYESGFTYIAEFFAYEELHFSFFMGFWAAVQIFFVYYSVRDSRFLLPYIAVFIILGPTFLNWTNGLRQCVVGCTFIYLVEFIVKRKLLIYIIGILLCSLIHKSAILLIPFYWIFNKPLFTSKRTFIIAIVVVCTIIGQTPSWLNLVNYGQDAIYLLGYDSYANKLDDIIQNTTETIAWGPGRIGLYILDLFALYLYPVFKEKYNLGKKFEIYYYAFFIGSCLFNLFANTSHLFLRPVAYFRDFRIIVVPICLYFLQKERKKQWLFIIVSILAYFYTLYASSKAFMGGKGIDAPEVYKFFFLQ